MHSLGLKSDATIAAWGNNNYGQCTVPWPNSDFVAVAAGYGHSLGLKRSGGACCEPTGICAVLPEEDCPQTSVWQGEGTACSPENPCLSGACCLRSDLNICEIHPPSQCAAYNGIYRGNGTLCNPNPCPALIGVEAGAPDVPRLQLLTVPNPSSGDVVIRCLLRSQEVTTVVLFDAPSRMVRRLHEGQLPAGETRLSWDGRDDAGRDVPAGVYLVKVTTSTGETSERVVLTR